MYLLGLTYQENVVVVHMPLFPWAEKLSNTGIVPSGPEADWWPPNTVEQNCVNNQIIRGKAKISYMF